MMRQVVRLGCLPPLCLGLVLWALVGLALLVAAVGRIDSGPVSVYSPAAAPSSSQPADVWDGPLYWIDSD